LFNPQSYPCLCYKRVYDKQNVSGNFRMKKIHLFLTVLALSFNTQSFKAQASSGLGDEENGTCGKSTCRSHCSFVKKQADEAYKIAREQMLHASGLILSGGLCGLLAKKRPLLRWTTISIASITSIPGFKRSWEHYNTYRTLSSTLDRN
jgi:hypothetical protein